MINYKLLEVKFKQSILRHVILRLKKKKKKESDSFISCVATCKLTTIKFISQGKKLRSIMEE